MNPDVQIAYCGSVAMVTPRTPEATQWIDENVPLESWQWIGGCSWACEPRYVDQLIEGMQQDGLKVEVIK